MTLLLDANVLIALVNQQHVHHWRARTWFAKTKRSFATCPITQGALVRHYFREAKRPSASEAAMLIQRVEEVEGHNFWPDTVSYTKVDYTEVIGHRQITDAYLVTLARAHEGKLVTINHGICLLYLDHSTWIDTIDDESKPSL